jgi:histidinol dehydrogenase
VKKEGALYIEGDTSLPYGVIITAMAVAKNAGVEKVMMLTDPTDQIKLSDLDTKAKVPPRTSPSP